ncbi:DUF305 domain-containing protein [Antrihabitans sp. YC3-6]|uniref:DUF305 domain-containing protein n=1 Tax=Antrihabitans stalagmiti TaxID=2799499 RepID=A0A934NSU2_9NOCA|nr:DUF305 domain-containing protein [Antrihabitans stalagmiti]MBJ8340841.1 DUF305 domain-containing protein [Antrihabitans stalagmiti]
MRSTTIKIAASATVAAAALVLAGCSDDSDGNHDMGQMSNSAAMGTSAPSATAEASAEFNDADVTFTQMMYPHHAQAVEMAKLVDGRTSNPQVIELADSIEGAQAPEMEQMTRMLAAWGKPAPSDMGGTNHGGGMSGMMPPGQMADLAAKTGEEFDTAWLTMMIDHHNGAIEMARTELADGKNGEAKALAGNIIAAQEAEIATMNGLLQK